MARHAGQPKQKKNLYLRTDICELYDLLLTPVGETKLPHGAWSDLIEKLLRQNWKTLPKEQKEALERQLVARKKKQTEEVLSLIR